MGQLHCRHRLAAFLVVLVWLSNGSFAQQAYNSQDGFVCTDASVKSCETFALYRVQNEYPTIASIASLFGANQIEVARISNLSVDQVLSTGEAVFVPLSCTCNLNNSISFANISRTIIFGDTFFDLCSSDFEGLCSTTAIINANPGVNYHNLAVGSSAVIPVACACPSSAQIASNVASLVSYAVAKGDSVGLISSEFGVPSVDVLNANELVGANAQIIAGTQLLIPINSTVPNFKSMSSNSPSPASPSPTVSTPNGSSGKGGVSSGVYVAIGVGAFAALLFCAVACCCLFPGVRRRRKSRGRLDTEAPLVTGKSSKDSTPNQSVGVQASGRMAPGDPLAGMADMVDSERPTMFTFEELKDATDNFSDGSKLQGSVYRGILRGQVLAIKQMKGNMSQELQILGKVHHTNLIKLVGICVTEAEHLYLVYEYAENGSLSDCLHTDFLSRKKLASKSSAYLSWTTRLQIALDTASGLEYIHDYVNPSYVHKDVKSSNILLDGAFRAKIANFAMAKSGGNNAMMTRHIAGTYGYMAPEYLAHGLVTTKADVFAFGVVLLELLSGQEAISEDVHGEERCLYSAIKPILDSADPAASLKAWMDPVLQNNYPIDTALNVASLAKACVEMDPTPRPSMKDITFALSNLLNATMEWETSAVFANALLEIPIEAR